MKQIKPRAVLNSARQEAERVFKKIRSQFKKTFRTKRNRRRGIYALGILLILTLSIHSAIAQTRANELNSQIHYDQAQLSNRQKRLQTLQSDLKTVENQKATTDTELKQKSDSEAQLKAQVEDLNKQVQSKAAAKQSLAEAAINAVTFTQPAEAEAEPVSAPSHSYSGNLSSWLYALRMCESSGNYQTNTGNGFYGAYQFTISTWDSLGTGYARADLAPPAVQDQAIIDNTNRSSGGLATQNPGCYASRGLSAFPPQ